MNKPASYQPSSGWRYLTDMELARKLANGDVHHPGLISMGFEQECRVRGLKVVSCSECDTDSVHQGHDYICLICRSRIS